MALPKLLVDAVWGIESRKAMQRHLKYRGFYSGLVDGSFGALSKKGLQRLMKAHGYYTGLIDGDFGDMSAYAYHRFLKGAWGGSKWLANAASKGIYALPWDPQTQAFYAGYVKDVIRATQNGLNKYGTF